MKILGWSTLGVLGVLGLVGAAGLELAGPRDGLSSLVESPAARLAGAGAAPPGAGRSLLVVVTAADRGEVEPCG